MKRVLGWVCGVALALVTGLWWVTATSDLALSAGLYGTPGTYKVDSCYDADPYGKNPVTTATGPSPRSAAPPAMPTP